jgi:hypothetical protein
MRFRQVGSLAQLAIRTECEMNESNRIHTQCPVHRYKMMRFRCTDRRASPSGFPASPQTKATLSLLGVKFLLPYVLPSDIARST